MATKRWSVAAVIAGLSLAIGAVACSSGEGSTASSTTISPETAVTQPDALAVADVDAATRSRVIDELSAAVAAVRAFPVEITTEMLEDGEPRTGSARVDPPGELLDSLLVAPLSSGSAVTTRHVVVDGRAFLKSTTSAEAEAALDFTELPFEPIGAELLEEVYAGYGRIDKSLDRILTLLENVPFAARVTPLDNGTEISVVMSPRSIADYYAATGLEAVGGTIPPERTQLAFRIDDGVLRGLVAGGTHFHDGEALVVSATIAYTPIDPFTLEVPPTED